MLFVDKEYVCVCVSLLIRSVQRYSIERFVVHSYVLMTQELKSSIICCPFRYRLIGVVLPNLDYRCRQLQLSGTLRKMAGGSFGGSTEEGKKKKGRKKILRKAWHVRMCLGPLSKLSDVNPNDTSSSMLPHTFHTTTAMTTLPN